MLYFARQIFVFRPYAQNKRKQGIPDLELAVPTQEALLGGIHVWRLHDHAEQLAAVRKFVRSFVPSEPLFSTTKNKMPSQNYLRLITAQSIPFFTTLYCNSSIPPRSSNEAIVHVPVANSICASQRCADQSCLRVELDNCLLGDRISNLRVL